MVKSLVSLPKAQALLAAQARERRLQVGLTQVGLAERSGVALPTLRKFERTGLISLESYLKLQMVLGGLEALIEAAAPPQETFTSIDDVLTADEKPIRKRGWRK